MRKIWIVPVVAVAALAYWAWPYAGAYALAEAARSRDAAALAARIDEPALKRSLTRQIVSATLKKSGKADKMGAFQRGLANAAGASIAAPYLDQLLAPETLATLLAQGHIGALTVGDRRIVIDRDLPALSAITQSHLTDVLLHSAYDGLASFRFSIPAAPDDGGDYGVHLRLSGLTWRLSGLDLPPDVIDRIAADAVAAERKADPSKG